MGTLMCATLTPGFHVPFHERVFFLVLVNEAMKSPAMKDEKISRGKRFSFYPQS